MKILAKLFLVLLLASQSLPAEAHERRSAVVEAIEAAGPAVVNIRTEQIVQRRSTPFFGFGDAFFDDFFRQFAPSRSYRTQALGSGAIIDPRGYLVTNAHVVEKASRIYVALPGEQLEREASLVGIDPVTDLAVIRLESDSPLPSLPLGRSDDLLLGETVIAIGNPLGLENSVTTGVVSAPRRRLPDGLGGVSLFIQTDALINPGNSGGPLININGELIGINTAIAEQAQGIGFAIPVERARRVVADLIAYGRVRPLYSGILPGEIGRAMTRSRGSGGALVTEVDAGSPAARGGVQVGDVILSVDGVQVDSASEFLALLRTASPGSPVPLHLLRGVDEIDRSLVPITVPEGYVEKYLRRVFGFSVVADRGGVSVAEVISGSPAAGRGLRPGDLIVGVGGQSIESLEDFTLFMEEAIGRLPLRFAGYRRNRGFYLDLP